MGTVHATWDQMLALGGCGDGKLRIWNLKTGAQVKSWSAHQGGVWALQVNWQKKQALSGGENHETMGFRAVDLPPKGRRPPWWDYVRGYGLDQPPMSCGCRGRLGQ